MIDRPSLPLMLALMLAATPVLAQSGSGAPPPTPAIPATPAIPPTPAVPGRPVTPNASAVPATPAVPGRPATSAAPPVSPPTPGIPAATGIPAAPGAPPPTPAIPATQKVALTELEKRLPEHVFGMKRLKVENKANLLQALYQGQAGRATLLVDGRNVAVVPNGVAAPAVEKSVNDATNVDAKTRVPALGERYWQSEPSMKRIEEKRAGMTVLCGLIERRANTQEKTPEQVRMRSASCATGAAGQLVTLRMTTPYKGAVEADAWKAQELFVMAIAQSIAGQIRAEKP